MLEDAQKDAVIVALADALVEISQWPIYQEAVRACVERFEGENPFPFDVANPFSITAREMRDIALGRSKTLQRVRELAAAVLRENAEAIASRRSVHLSSNMFGSHVGVPQRHRHRAVAQDLLLEVRRSIQAGQGAAGYLWVTSSP